MENQYQGSTNINYISVLDYIEQYGNTPYYKPEKAATSEEQERLLGIKQKAQDAVDELKKIAALCKQKFGLDECLRIPWLNGAGTTTRSYLWAQMKYSHRKDNPISISIFAEKKNATEAQYRIKLEVRTDSADVARMKQYHSHLDLPLNQDAGLVYFVYDPAADVWSPRTESHEQIREELNAGKFERVQIVGTVDRQPGKTNEDFEQSLLAAVEALLPYYNYVTEKELNTCQLQETYSGCIGITDSPADTDEFGIGHYIDGLSEFILNCDTPMTISIQGSWGSGKTSIMKMVQNRIQDKVLPVFFNTWQFSQFNLGNSLPLSMIRFFLEEIGVQQDKLYKALNIIGAVSAMVANAAVNAVSDGVVEKVFGNPLGNKEEDLAHTIKNLHDSLQKHVQEACEKAKKDRIVVFVDDLDRLMPVKAMELLEVLKIFLDCKQCVFVLAIDYDVVVRGAAAKYGFNLNDKSPEGLKEAEKGRAFFDKIIQVPFKMPVVEYDVSKYMKEGLRKIHVNPNEEDMATYQNLCAYSVGTNPRGLKRILNAFLLLNIMRAAKAEPIEDSKQQLILFGLLCLQQYKESIYNLIVRVNRRIDGDDATEIFELFTRLLNDPEAAKHINESYRTKLLQSDIQAFRPFLEEFLQLLEIKPLNFLLDENFEETNEEQQKRIDANSEKYQLFNQVLTLSASTASDTDSSQAHDEPKKKTRFTMAAACNQRINELKEFLENNDDFNQHFMMGHSWNGGFEVKFHSRSCKYWMFIGRHKKDILVGYSSFSQDYLELYEIKDEFHKELGYELEWMDTTTKRKTKDATICYSGYDYKNTRKCKELYPAILTKLLELSDAFYKVMS